MFSLRSLQQYTSISSPYFCAIVVIYIFLINLFILFIYFWLHWVFVAVCGLSLVAESGGHSSLQCPGFSLRWLLLLRSTGSRHAGVSSCGTRAQQLWLVGSRVQAQQLWHTGLVAPRHVGSSRTRARTRVPCVGRQVLNHCTTREALLLQILILHVIIPIIHCYYLYLVNFLLNRYYIK